MVEASKAILFCVPCHMNKKGEENREVSVQYESLALVT